MNIFKRISLTKKKKKNNPLQKIDSFKKNVKDKRGKLQQQPSFESSSEDDLSVLNACYDEESTLDGRSEFFSIAPYKDDDDSTCCFVSIRNSRSPNNDDKENSENKSNARGSSNYFVPNRNLLDDSTTESSLVYDINNLLNLEENVGESATLPSTNNSMDYSQSVVEESALDTPVRCGSSRKCVQMHEIQKIRKTALCVELFPSCGGEDATSFDHDDDDDDEEWAGGRKKRGRRETRDARFSLGATAATPSVPVDVDEFISNSELGALAPKEEDERRNRIYEGETGRDSVSTLHPQAPPPVTVSRILAALSADDEDDAYYESDERRVSEVLYPKRPNKTRAPPPPPPTSGANPPDRRRRRADGRDRDYSDSRAMISRKDDGTARVVTPESSPSGPVERRSKGSGRVDDDDDGADDGATRHHPRGRSRTPRLVAPSRRAGANAGVVVADRRTRSDNEQRTERDDGGRRPRRAPKGSRTKTDRRGSSPFVDGNSPVVVVEKERSRSNSDKRDLLNKRKCVICVKRNRTHLAVPCMHFSFCKTCASDLSRNLKHVSCPICGERGVTFAELKY